MCDGAGSAVRGSELPSLMMQASEVDTSLGETGAQQLITFGCSSVLLCEGSKLKVLRDVQEVRAQVRCLCMFY
jgi:hypothetical protein